MHHIPISPARKAEWEALVKATPSSGFMQSFFWAEFRNLLGWETYKIGIEESGKLIGGAIVAKYSHYPYGNFLSIAEGPIIPYESPQAEQLFHQFIAEVDSLANLTGDHKSSHLSIEPKLQTVPSYFSRFEKAPTDQQPFRTLLIDLTVGEKEILTQMKPKGRYNIGIAQKRGVVVVEKKIQEGMADFVSLYHEFVDRMKIEQKDDAYFTCLSSVLQKENNASIYHALYQGKILASAIVIDYGAMTTYLFGASSDAYPSVMAPYLLHWEIIRAAKKRCQQVYDFYSLVPDKNDTTHPWYGYSQFKQKFGGEIKQYIGAYDFIYNKELYKKYLSIT